MPLELVESVVKDIDWEKLAHFNRRGLEWAFGIEDNLWGYRRQLMGTK